MTIPRPRLTVRRLMILVALAGLIAGGWVEGERRRVRFRWYEIEYSNRLWDYRLEHNLADDPPDPARLAWHVTMYHKYEFAVRYPWLPVWPDPPEPE